MTNESSPRDSGREEAPASSREEETNRESQERTPPEPKVRITKFDWVSAGWDPSSKPPSWYSELQKKSGGE